ncbi:hypothetical protein BKI52_12920 [marine bacterium AO1-C]|nr:hypothetical protein BKI52_12920 [marine bacterium AO1-C]
MKLHTTFVLLFVTNIIFAQTTTPNQPKKDEIKYLEDHNKLRIGIRGGMAFLTANSTGESNADLQGLRDKMSSGIQFGADIHYFTSEFVGWGLKYSSFGTSGSTTVSVAASNGSGATVEQDYAESLVARFYGPSFTTRILSSNAKNVYTLGFAMGYMDYMNSLNFFGQSFEARSNALGLSWTAGWDWMFSKNFAASLSLTYTMGALKTFDVEGANSQQLTSINETLLSDISRLEISLGISFYK